MLLETNIENYAKLSWTLARDSWNICHSWGLFQLEWMQRTEAAVGAGPVRIRILCQPWPVTLILNKHWTGAAKESLVIKHSLVSTDQFYDWLSLWWIGCDNSGDFEHTIGSCPSHHDWGLKYCTDTALCPHSSGILLLLMASNCNFLVFCSVDWRQKYNCCLPCHQLDTGFCHIEGGFLQFRQFLEYLLKKN